MKPERREAFRVLRAQAGDTAALDALLAESQRRLLPCLVRILGDRDLAEDVMQEVFVAIYRDLRWLREPRFFRSWSYRIAVRLALKHLRRRKKQVALALNESQLATTTTPAPDEQLLAMLRSGVETLSLGDRFVVVLHYFEGLRLREVGDLLEVPLGTIKSRLAHALAGLRQDLATYRNSGKESEHELGTP